MNDRNAIMTAIDNMPADDARAMLRTSLLAFGEVADFANNGRVLALASAVNIESRAAGPKVPADMLEPIQHALADIRQLSGLLAPLAAQAKRAYAQLLDAIPNAGEPDTEKRDGSGAAFEAYCILRDAGEGIDGIIFDLDGCVPWLLDHDATSKAAQAEHDARRGVSDD